MKNKNLIIVSSIISIILIIIIILNYQKLGVDKNTENNPETNNNAIENQEIYEINQLKLEQQENIIRYVSENISQLSPEKEVLGGKFYINSIDFLSSASLIVFYEDGHNSFLAEVQFEYNDPENIEILNFKILN